MDYEFLIKDIDLNISQKNIGTDKGLAKIGDGIVNLSYSVAKSIFLTKNNLNKKVIRTGSKVSKNILAIALKNADLRKFAKTRADSHDLADTAEAIIAYIWLHGKFDLHDMINILVNNLKGNLYNRTEEIKYATEAFTILFANIKPFLPKI
jgi:hypothetical protein